MKSDVVFVSIQVVNTSFDDVQLCLNGVIEEAVKAFSSWSEKWGCRHTGKRIYCLCQTQQIFCSENSRFLSATSEKKQQTDIYRTLQKDIQSGRYTDKRMDAFLGITEPADRQIYKQ